MFVGYCTFDGKRRDFLVSNCAIDVGTFYPYINFTYSTPYTKHISFVMTMMKEQRTIRTPHK